MPDWTDRRKAAENVGKRLDVAMRERVPEPFIELREATSHRRELWIMLIILVLAVCFAGAEVLLDFKRDAGAVQILASGIPAVVTLISVVLARRSVLMATRLEHTIAEDRIEPHEAEAATLIRALEVFGNSERALQWMRENNPALDNEPPIRIIRTENGRREVLNVLGRIEHGVIS